MDTISRINSYIFFIRIEVVNLSSILCQMFRNLECCQITLMLPVVKLREDGHTERHCGLQSLQFSFLCHLDSSRFITVFICTVVSQVWWIYSVVVRIRLSNEDGEANAYLQCNKPSIDTTFVYYIVKITPILSLPEMKFQWLC
jgi:hypothetical protein